MSVNLTPVFMFSIVFGTVYLLVVAVTNFILRRKLIQMGDVDPTAIDLITKKFYTFTNNLKWGLILLFAGVGLVVIDALGINEVEPKAALSIGLELIFVAIGFLLYFLYMRRNQDGEL